MKLVYSSLFIKIFKGWNYFSKQKKKVVNYTAFKYHIILEIWQWEFGKNFSWTGYELMGAEVLPGVVNNIAYTSKIKTKDEIRYTLYCTFRNYASVFT